jgi:hypothetical protein
MSVKPAALIAAISRSLDTVTDAADAHVIQIQMFIVMKCLQHRVQYVLYYLGVASVSAGLKRRYYPSQTVHLPLGFHNCRPVCAYRHGARFTKN